ncbi:hypothetical protein M2368_003198 [Arthrobacter sp. JUb119]|nr:hypothetical protein [Arthrobacter sp. MYb222]MCS3494170.1 hypothetical protein [Arthrobacter sp. JUb119]
MGTVNYVLRHAPRHFALSAVPAGRFRIGGCGARDPEVLPQAATRS